MNETRILSEFIADLKLAKIPESVKKRALNLILDALGVGIFATQTPWGKIMSDYANDEGSAGYSSILGSKGHRCRPSLAALVNGTAVHGFEMDDVHYPSISHPGAVIVPAALALSEQLNLSGGDFLVAVIAGYEAMGRIGASVAKVHLSKGFHPTGTFGAFGSAASCGRLIGLSSERFQDALGLAGSFASGLAQFSVTGSMVKRIHAGHAAESGVKASCLAAKGFTGPREILEGKYGFLKVFNQDSQPVKWNKLTEKLGKKYIVEEISIKPSAACGVLHSVIDCIEKIGMERELAPSNIKNIIVCGHENLVNEHNVYRPKSILAAQYSLPFTVGLAVTGKLNNPTTYLDDAILHDEDVLSVGDKVNTKMDNEIQSAFPEHFGARVKITFKDGIKAEHTAMDPIGSNENPLTRLQLENKFINCIRKTLGEEIGQKLINRVFSLENMPSIRQLLAQL